MSFNRSGYIGRAPGDSAITIARKTYEPTGVQTDFTFTAGYDPGYCDVYVNGVRLISGNDYTASNGSTVGLTSAAQNGDIIEVVAYKAFNLGVPLSNITGDLSITGSVSASSSITADNGVYGTFYGSGSGLTGVASTDYIITGTAATFNSQVKVLNLNVTGITSTTSFNVGSATTIDGGGINVTGVITATTFSGNLTGDVTGGISGGTVAGSTGTFSGAVNVDDTTDSTSATSGALIVDGGLGVAKNVYIGAGLSVAGTLTYEDVTNVDSVGLITAKSGVNVSGGQLAVGVAYSVGAAGVATAAGFVGPLTGAVTGNADSATTATNVTVADESSDTTCFPTFVTAATGNLPPKSGSNLTFNASSGALTATSFVGDGSNLSGITGTTINSNADNRLITGSGTANTLNGETNLTFDGASLKVGTGITMAATAGVVTFANASADTANTLKFGDNNDLTIRHDGANYGYVECNTGSLFIRGSAGTHIMCANGTYTSLYYGGSVKLATTNDGVNISGICTATGAAFSTGDGVLREKCYVVANKLSAFSSSNISLTSGMVWYYTTQETTTSTPNIRFSSGITLNNKMSTGEVVVVTLITTAAAAAYSAQMTIDGAAQTEEWVGGSAPSAGGSDGLDIYSYTIIKTADATFKVIANYVNATN